MSHCTLPLNRQDYKTLTLAALGGALEFYDFIIFVFFATVVGKLFFPADMPEWLRLMQTFGIFAAGYLARPLGGIVMAHFGDLLGRKKMFTLSIFMMAVPTLIMGLLPTYAQIGMWAPILLLLMRVIQGAAIGGEVPGAWVFVAEHVPPRHVGYACGTLTCGLTAGILLGSLVATAINPAIGIGTFMFIVHVSLLPSTLPFSTSSEPIAPAFCPVKLSPLLVTVKTDFWSPIGDLVTQS